MRAVDAPIQFWPRHDEKHRRQPRGGAAAEPRVEGDDRPPSDDDGDPRFGKGAGKSAGGRGKGGKVAEPPDEIWWRMLGPLMDEVVDLGDDPPRLRKPSPKPPTPSSEVAVEPDGVPPPVVEPEVVPPPEVAEKQSYAKTKLYLEDGTLTYRKHPAQRRTEELRRALPFSR